MSADPGFQACDDCLVIRHCTLWPDHVRPHTAPAIKIGSSSLTVMGYPAVVSSHGNWNHRIANHAPQPHCPDASEAIVCSGREERVGRKETPFQSLLEGGRGWQEGDSIPVLNKALLPGQVHSELYSNGLEWCLYPGLRGDVNGAGLTSCAGKIALHGPPCRHGLADLLATQGPSACRSSCHSTAPAGSAGGPPCRHGLADPPATRGPSACRSSCHSTAPVGFAGGPPCRHGLADPLATRGPSACRSSCRPLLQ